MYRQPQAVASELHAPLLIHHEVAVTAGIKERYFPCVIASRVRDDMGESTCRHHPYSFDVPFLCFIQQTTRMRDKDMNIPNSKQQKIEKNWFTIMSEDGPKAEVVTGLVQFGPYQTDK